MSFDAFDERLYTQPLTEGAVSSEGVAHILKGHMEYFDNGIKHFDLFAKVIQAGSDYEKNFDFIVACRELKLAHEELTRMVEMLEKYS